MWLISFLLTKRELYAILFYVVNLYCEVMHLYMLSMNFRIPRFAVRLFFRGRDGKVDLKRVEAFYDQKTLDELRDFPGLIWKVWAIREDACEGSGYYLFKTRHEAEVRAEYARRFYWRKGMLFVHTRIHEVLEDCSRYTRAPIDLPANPVISPEQEYTILHPKLQSFIMMIREKRKLLKGIK